MIKCYSKGIANWREKICTSSDSRDMALKIFKSTSLGLISLINKMIGFVQINVSQRVLFECQSWEILCKRRMPLSCQLAKAPYDTSTWRGTMHSGVLKALQFLKVENKIQFKKSLFWFQIKNSFLAITIAILWEHTVYHWIRWFPLSSKPQQLENNFKNTLTSGDLNITLLGKLFKK